MEYSGWIRGFNIIDDWMKGVFFGMSKAVSYVWTAVDGITGGDLCGVFFFLSVCLSVWAALVRCNIFFSEGNKSGCAFFITCVG